MISADQLYPVFESERELELARHPIYASQKMETAVAELTDELMPMRQLLESAGYAVSTAVRFGDPAHAIVAYAAGEGIDLIAMTTHGRTGLPRLIAGSVASYVVQHAQVPVLLFRPAALAVEQPESTIVLAAE
jgi:nucleotide-binding universal stress UspA family protein